MPFTVGFTYYVDASLDNIASKRLGYIDGLVSMRFADPKVYQTAISQGLAYVTYHISKKDSWIPESLIREAEPTDFRIGDVITENALALFDMVITDILDFTSPSTPLSLITTPPIVAEQLDESGVKTGNIYHLDPHECIVQERAEDTQEVKRESDPITNDGRKTCFWCGGKLEQVPGFNFSVYDICPKCKK